MMDKQGLQMYVARYITNAKGFLKNIWIGVFPQSDEDKSVINVR